MTLKFSKEHLSTCGNCNDHVFLKHIFLSPVWTIDMNSVAYWMIFTYKYGYLGRTRNIKDFI